MDSGLKSNSEGTTSVEMPLKINTYDIDVAGHVNNIVFLKWMEEMRNLFFERICGLELFITKGYYPVIAHTELRYKKQLRLYDHPVGFMRLDNCRRGIIMFSAEILVDGKTVFTGSQKCVIISLKTGEFYKGDINSLKNYLVEWIP